MRSRILLILLLVTSVCAPAQELAHRGWRGNGIAPESWWRHATFVRFGPDSTYADVAGTLDNISAVGADSLILPDPEPQPGASLPFADRFGSQEDLDGLLREASARRLHVLLRAPLQRLASNPGELRFWLSRGVAGFDLGTVGPGDSEAVRGLRAAMDRSPGQRILLARTPGISGDGAQAVAVPRSASRREVAGDPVTLHIVSTEDAELNHPQNPQQLVEIVAAAPAAVVEQPGAAVLPASVPTLRNLIPLLLAPGAPILDSRLLKSEGDCSALQQVLNVRNTHMTLRNGQVTTVVSEPVGLKGWVLRGGHGRQLENLLLVENTAAQAVPLRLTGPLAHAGLRGTYVRPLLRSDGAMGAVNLDTGSLPPGAAVLGVIGE